MAAILNDSTLHLNKLRDSLRRDTRFSQAGSSGRRPTYGTVRAERELRSGTWTELTGVMVFNDPSGWPQLRVESEAIVGQRIYLVMLQRRDGEPRLLAKETDLDKLLNLLRLFAGTIL